MRASLRNNGQAYGYSVSITVALALLNADAKLAGTAHLIYFALGAAVAFSLLQALASAGFRKPLEPEPSTVTAMGVSLSLVSVGTSAVLAWGCAHYIDGVAAWPVTSFAVSAVYLMVAGAELALAERAQAASEHGEKVEKQTDEEEREHREDPAEE
ncbi:hypothetical protein STVIR_7711 [Streptomyces viridochromogenes Tue57]|uniref:Integral membrane protein n=1 Tax=Streptomyces viridochromogenes Tue57 TaxID=1160705 RepID=L8P7N7_STRVR|nr:hypothetical protein STVIR_7711 [Streptomyces viridochromogenes Tue57]